MNSYFENLKTDIKLDACKNILRKIILTAFGYDKMDHIDLVYPKKAPETREKLEQMCEKWLSSQVRNLSKSNEYTEASTLENLFEKMALNEENGEDDNDFQYKNFVKSYTD